MQRHNGPMCADRTSLCHTLHQNKRQLHSARMAVPMNTIWFGCELGCPAQYAATAASVQRDKLAYAESAIPHTMLVPCVCRTSATSLLLAPALWKTKAPMAAAWQCRWEQHDSTLPGTMHAGCQPTPLKLPNMASTHVFLRTTT